MGEVQAGDAGGRVHREAFGEPDARGPLGVEQVEESAFFGVVGLGRVAGGRADAAVFFGDQVFVRKFSASPKPQSRRASACRYSANASARRSASALVRIEL